MSDGIQSGGTAVRIGRMVLLVGSLVLLLYLMRPVYTPLLISFLIAYLTAPLVDYLESLGVPRVISISIIFIIFFLLLAFFIVFLMPAVTDEARGMVQSIPKFLKSIDSKLQGWKLLNSLESYVPGFKTAALTDRLMAQLRGYGSTFLSDVPGYVRGLGSFFILFILVPFITFFFLKDGRPIKRFFINMVPNRYFEMALVLLHEVAANLGGYLRGQMVRMIVISFLIWLGLFLIDIPYAVVLAIFCGIMNIIPFLGPWLGAIPAVIVAMVTGQSVLAVVLVNVIVQVLDMVVVNPVAMSKGAQLPALVVVLVVIIGGHLMGIPGMVLAVPITSILRVTIAVVRENLRSYEIA